MTVNTTNITSGPYAGNGSTSQFSYTFRVDDKSQVIVYETDDTGVVSTLTVDADYTVNNVGTDGGGTIDRLAGALPANYTWYIRSNYASTQDTDFASQGGFFPDVHEKSFDKLTFVNQQQQDQINRTVKFSDSYSGSASTVLPNPESDKVLVWSTDALSLVNGPAESTFMTYASNALASQVAALASETASGVSAAASQASADASAASAVLAADIANDMRRNTYADGVDFTAGVTTQLVLSTEAGDIDNTWVYFDGVYQSKAGYAINNDTEVDFTVAIPGGVSEVEIIYGVAVTQAIGTVQASSVVNVPTGSVSATNVQAAINELATEKEPADGTILKNANLGSTVQAYDSNTAKTDVVQTFTKAQRGAVATLTDQATITHDLSLSNNFTVTLTDNRTLGNFTNVVAGQSGSIFIVQDATGGRTLAYGSHWDTPGGVAPTLSTAASAVDRLDYIVISATSIHYSVALDVK